MFLSLYQGPIQLWELRFTYSFLTFRERCRLESFLDANYLTPHTATAMATAD